MATQIVGENIHYKRSSYIYDRGYHEYKSAWLPTVGEMLRLTTELIDSQDAVTVAVIKGDCVVEHVQGQSVRLSPFSSERTGASASVK